MAAAQNLPQPFSFPPYQTESARPPLQGPYTFMCMCKEDESNFPNTISVIRMCGCALWPLRLPSLNPTTYNYIILKLHHHLEWALPLTPVDFLWKPSSDSHRCISKQLFPHVILEKHTFALLGNSVHSWERGNPSKETRLPNASEIWSQPCSVWASLAAQLVKESTCNAGDLGSIPGLGRSPGEGKCYPFQYSGLEDSRGCIVHGVAKTWTWPSYFHVHFHVLFTTVFLDYWRWLH